MLKPKALFNEPYAEYIELSDGILIKGLHLIFWCFVRPSAWKSYINHLDSDLSSDFCLSELDNIQRGSPHIKSLMRSAYLILPMYSFIIISLTMWLFSYKNIIENTIFVVLFSLALSMVIGFFFSFIVGLIIGSTSSVMIGVFTALLHNSTIGYLTSGMLLGASIAPVSIMLVSSPQRSIFEATENILNKLSQQKRGLEIIAIILPIMFTATILWFGFSMSSIGDNLEQGERILIKAFLTNTVLAILSGAVLGILFIFLIWLFMITFEQQWGAAFLSIGTLGFCVTSLILITHGIFGWSILNYLLGLSLTSTLIWWQSAIMWPLLLIWNFILYQIDIRNRKSPPALRYNSAFWDEYQRLPLLRLKKYLVSLSTYDFDAAQNAIHRLKRTQHYRSAQHAQIEISEQNLWMCEDIYTIANAYRSLMVNDIQDSIGSFLRRFSRVSKSVEKCLSLNSYYEQSEQFKSIDESLDSLVKDLEEKESKHHRILLNVATYWQQIVFSFTEELIKLVEMQIEQIRETFNRCDNIAKIKDIHKLRIIEPGPIDPLLRTFTRISQDVETSLDQVSSFNQRLALKTIEDRLDSLSRELSISNNKYSRRFLMVVDQWQRILADHAIMLARTSEQRQEIESPYIIGVPLTAQQEIFVGRSDVSTRIEQLLLDQRQPPLMLYGQRRMGKTSLLNNLSRLLPSTVIPLFVDLQGAPSRSNSYAGFLYNVARSMLISAKQQRDLALPTIDLETINKDPSTQFDEWLDAIGSVIGDNIALLMFDEFESLDKAISRGRFDEDTVLGTIRNLIQHKHKFKVLISGSHTLEEFRRWSGYLINAQLVHIGYLKESEALQLIERPVKNFSLKYEPEASQRILRLTRCHPFLVQLLCAEIVAFKNEQSPSLRRVARIEDVNEAVPRALATGDMFFADIANNQVNPDGLALMRAMAKFGEGAVINPNTLLQLVKGNRERIFDLLIQRELIEKTEGGVRFQVELVRQWFLQ